MTQYKYTRLISMTSVGLNSLKMPAKLASTSTCPNVLTTSLNAFSISACLRMSTLWNKTVLLGNWDFNWAIASLGSETSNIATFYKNYTQIIFYFIFYEIVPWITSTSMAKSFRIKFKPMLPNLAPPTTTKFCFSNVVMLNWEQVCDSVQYFQTIERSYRSGMPFIDVMFSF